MHELPDYLEALPSYTEEERRQRARKFLGAKVTSWTVIFGGGTGVWFHHPECIPVLIGGVMLLGSSIIRGYLFEDEIWELTE